MYTKGMWGLLVMNIGTANMQENSQAVKQEQAGYKGTNKQM